jgi:hypothetical protein
MINPSPWKVGVEASLVAETAAQWRRLGADADSTSTTPSSGNLVVGQNSWTASLEPYSLIAWEFSETRLRTGEFVVRVDQAARGELAKRMEQIEQRINNINYQRPYLALDNPGYEADGQADRIPGWQAMVGNGGVVQVHEDGPFEGSKSLYLKSEDGGGVAAVSELFDIPKTGRLSVRPHVRFRGCEANTRLFLQLQYQGEAGLTTDWASLDPSRFAEDRWTPVEKASDQLPLGSAGKMRIVLHLVGPGEAWIDDVKMFDVQLADSQRVEFGKRYLAAQRALQKDQFSECLELVDGYWQQYLVEFVPPSSSVGEGTRIDVASRPDGASSDDGANALDDARSNTFGDRMRQFVPRIRR